MDKKSNIYYLMRYDGQCIIKQIRPNKDDRASHLTIFEIKAEKCYGFNLGRNNNFYFIDETKTINKIRKQKEGYMLEEVGEVFLKDKDRAHFKETEFFPQLIVSEKYMVQGQRIFYLWKHKPLEPGILDSE